MLGEVGTSRYQRSTRSGRSRIGIEIAVWLNHRIKQMGNPRRRCVSPQEERRGLGPDRGNERERNNRMHEAFCSVDHGEHTGECQG